MVPQQVSFVERLSLSQRVPYLRHYDNFQFYSGAEQFTRRRKMSMPTVPLAPPTSLRPTTAPPAALRRVSGNLGLTLRRSPSPQRKISSGGTTPDNYQGVTPLRPLDSASLHRTNIPSPIPESPSSAQFSFQGGYQDMPLPSTSTPLGAPNIGPPKPPQPLSMATRPDTVHRRPRPSIV